MKQLFIFVTFFTARDEKIVMRQKNLLLDAAGFMFVYQKLTPTIISTLFGKVIFILFIFNKWRRKLSHVKISSE